MAKSVEFKKMYISEQKIQELIDRYSKAINDPSVNRDTLIKGTPIWKFSELGGGYQRIIDWCKEKLTSQKFDFEKVEEATRLLLEGIGEDPNREGLKDTPRRVAKMYNKILNGEDIDPKQYIVTFEAESNDMVMVKNITFYSFCEHHLQLFTGKMSIAYVPNKRIIGLSKLVRLARVFCKRVQVQERLTKQIADVIQEELRPEGTIVQLEAEHFCMSIRGVRLPGTKTITTAKRGVFQDNERLQEEFFKCL